MSNPIQIRLSKEQQKMLDKWAVENGFETPGKAAKALLLQALNEDSQQEKINSWLDKIETHVARAASRGTHASLASLCLQTAKANKDLEAKLSNMTASEQFDYAWNMASPLMKAGKPDYYRANKHAHMQKGLRDKDSLSLLKDVAEGKSAVLICKLDESDIAPWFEAMEIYRRTHKIMDAHYQEEPEWIEAYIEAQPAEKTLRLILEKMQITKSNVQSLFIHDENVFSNELGWHDADEDEFDERQDRKVYTYSPVRDFNDIHAYLYINSAGVWDWDDARHEGWI